ncbi:hypothetical protein V6Z12_A05G083500 [Gossypium hirsutum]
MVFCGIWLIRNSRNRLIHERKTETARELSQRIQSYMAELIGIIERSSTLTINKNHSSREINTRAETKFGAAFDKKNFKPASSLVAWDYLGELLASKTVLHSNVPLPCTVKAYIGLQAVKLGISLDLRSVVVRGDSRSVIKKMPITRTR